MRCEAALGGLLPVPERPAQGKGPFPSHHTPLKCRNGAKTRESLISRLEMIGEGIRMCKVQMQSPRCRDRKKLSSWEGSFRPATRADLPKTVEHGQQSTSTEARTLNIPRPLADRSPNSIERYNPTITTSRSMRCRSLSVPGHSTCGMVRRPIPRKVLAPGGVGCPPPSGSSNSCR